MLLLLQEKNKSNKTNNVCKKSHYNYYLKHLEFSFLFYYLLLLRSVDFSKVFDFPKYFNLEKTFL